MSIGSMPVELVELIVEHVSPNDIEAFGLTCSNLHHIASSRLEEHRDLNRKYSKIDMSAKAAKNPLCLMLELCSQPRALYYPKHAEFKDTENPSNWHGDDSEEVLQNHIRKITGMTPWILYDEMMAHFEGSTGLTQDELLAVSLCMFPNLKSIRFEACGGPFKHTTRAIKHVFAADTGSYGSQYLSKLSKVTVASRFLVGFGGMQWCAPFMAIPSLRIIQGDGFQSGRSTAYIGTAHKSEVTQIVFRDASISEEACVGLRSVKALEDFEYSHRRCYKKVQTELRDSQLSPCQIPRLLEILAHQAGKSLSTLKLDIPCEKCSKEPIKAVQAFASLKNVTLNAQVLFQGRVKPQCIGQYCGPTFSGTRTVLEGWLGNPYGKLAKA